MEFLSPEWWAALLAIIVVDLLLAGDNAVVIALAARNLPPALKKRAIIWGTLGAVIVRVVLVFFISQLLLLPGVSFVGGLALYVIAWRLIDDKPDDHARRPANDFWTAMSTIIIADTVMGLDNILAIAGAARGDLALIIFGLALSIPIMMGGSVFILKLLEKAPWLIVAGSALLCAIAGRIILDDKWFGQQVQFAPLTSWLVVVAITVIVTAGAVQWKRRKQRLML